MFKVSNSNKLYALLFSISHQESPVLRFSFLLRKSLLIGILSLAFYVNQLPAQTPPVGFSSSTVSSNWDQAVGLVFSKSGNQMFVWEKGGKVWVMENNIKSLLIDISEEVGNWRDFGLLGFALHPQFEANGYFYLLYTVDRHHLMHYGTSTYSDTTNEYFSATIGRLTRYTAAKMTNGYSADPNTRKILIGSTKSTGIPSLYQSHGVGSVVFGTDGTLLISAGEGASYASVDSGSATETYYARALADGIITSQENVGSFRSQLLESYDGKILRIDPETGDGIPGNPFYETGNPGSVRSKVWALGLRNPFRMILRPNSGSLNPADKNPGSLYVADVGRNTWEEISVVTKPGQNFGWPMFEGLTSTVYSNKNIYNKYAPNHLYGINGCTQEYFYFRNLIKQATASGVATFTNPCNNTQTIPNTIKTFLHTRPVIDFKHYGTTGPSRTGTFDGETATVVNIGADGSPVSGPQFSGNAAIAGCFYTHDDFPIEYTNTLFFGDYTMKWIKNMTVNESDKPIAVRNFIDSGAIVVAMATHPTKAGIYYVDYPSEIKKVIYTNKLPVAVALSDKAYGHSSLSVQFTGSKSTDADGRRLSYLWNFGDGTTSTLINPSHTFVTDTLTSYFVTLTVTDSLGGNDRDSLIISVNNTPPDVTISSPANNTLYPMIRDTVYPLRAIVSDQEHKSSQLSYRWQTILHHDDHQHPEPINTSRETTTTISPLGCGEETYYYRILLTVTDAAGLAATKEVKLYPDCNGINLPPANTAPELAPIGSKSVTLGQLLTFTATATDADAAQTKAFSLDAAPQGSAINSTTGVFSWTPNQAGTYTLTVRVTDNGSPALSDEEQIIVTVTTAPGNITQTLTPLADAFVRNGTYATKNYGADTSLVIKSSASTGYTRSSYLKFSLSNVSNVSSAKLRIYGRNTENTASINMSAYGLDNDSWTESGITWNNVPAASSAALGVVGVNNLAKYYEIDVANFVKTQFAGDKIVSFLIKDAAAQNKSLLFNSKENRQNKPQLVIETGDNDLTPPVVNIQFNGTSDSPNSYNNQVEVIINSSDQGGSGLASAQYSLNGAAYQNYNGSFIINNPGNYTIIAKATDGKGNTSVTDQIAFSVVSQGEPVTQTLTPVADAFVRNGTYATKNYGTDTSLIVKSSASTGYTRSSYFKFSLSNVSNVSLAKLRIYGRNTENTASINMSAYGLDNDTWTESGITWNNAPAAPSAALGVVGVNNLAKYYEVEVTYFVKTQLSGDKIVSFLIKDAAIQNKNLQFNSKENRQNKPQLIITTSSAITANRSLRYNANILGSENDSDKPKVYPNPLQKRFDIRFPDTYEGDLTMQVVNEGGKVYEIGKRRLSHGASTIPVDISNLSLRAGVYFLKIQSKSKSDVIKLIVQ